MDFVGPFFFWATVSYFALQFMWTSFKGMFTLGLDSYRKPNCQYMTVMCGKIGCPRCEIHYRRKGREPEAFEMIRTPAGTTKIVATDIAMDDDD